jgi:hypothetical protein
MRNKLQTPGHIRAGPPAGLPAFPGSLPPATKKIKFLMTSFPINNDHSIVLFTGREDDHFIEILQISPSKRARHLPKALPSSSLPLPSFPRAPSPALPRVPSKPITLPPPRYAST